jgi:O-antigen/teichoic acid export membrane protein
MLASNALAEKTLPVKGDEGRRVLRNTATIGAFLASPLHLFLMVRALGAGGYGRWWWTFVLLEAAGILGMLGSDLYVRREIPQLPDDETGRAEATNVVGSGLAIVCVTGVSLALLQIAFAVPLARAQDDPALVTFMIVLAFQPLTWNVGAILGAALQSRHHLGALAVIRGLVIPVMIAAVFWSAWHESLPVHVTLVLMLVNSFLAVGLVVVLYARHFSLGATLRAMFRPRHARASLTYGLRLFVPLALFTLGGKLDLYVLGAYYDPAYVGLYAACLQVASLVPNVRGLFDPVIMAQIGGLHADRREELGRSLRHLARLCAFALAPAFVVTVTVGQPVMSWLVGAPTAAVFVPLTVLALGHLLSYIAVAQWLMTMLAAGRVLAIIAAIAGIIKLVLLLVLVPRWGATGAAIAAAIGGVIAHQAQARYGARRMGFTPFPRSILPVLAFTLVAAAAGRALFEAVAGQTSSVIAVMISGSAAMVVACAGLYALMDVADRLELRRLLGMRPPGVPSAP